VRLAAHPALPAFGAETFVEFPRGTGSRALAAALAQAGVIRSRWDFLWQELSPQPRASRRRISLHPAASPLDVFDRIARGDSFYYALVVPEGRNMFDIAAAAANLGLFTAPKFLDAARDPALIRDLDPDAPLSKATSSPARTTWAATLLQPRCAAS